MLHFGLGETGYYHEDAAPLSSYNYGAEAKLGLVGCSNAGCSFPEISGIFATAGGGFAGLTTNGVGVASTATGSLGVGNFGIYNNLTPTAVGAYSWLKGNHSLKFGGEWRLATFTEKTLAGMGGDFTFQPQETGLPYLESGTLSGSDVGFPYASFYLGAVDSASITSGQDPTFEKQAWGIYGQDTWKMTRKITVDYGLRYDYQASWHERRNRWSEFGPNVVNSAAGGLLGGVQYENRAGAGSFTKTYPYGVAPRLGLAYQLSAKDVLRGGWGITYGPTNYIEYLGGDAIVGTGWNTLNWTPASFGVAPVTLKGGLIYPASALTQATYNPAYYPSPGAINGPEYYINPDAGRPSRINQWNITYQRQITPKISATVAYVGNRGVWLSSNLLDPNANTDQIFAKHGLDPTNPADWALLTSPVNSPQAQAAGFAAPYAGWPTGQTVAQSLRPYPQFGTIPGEWANNGNSWYDALQLKAEIRDYHGLFETVGYTHQRENSLGVAYPGAFGNVTLVNDVYDRAANYMIDEDSQPNIFNTAISYRSPAVGSSKALQMVTRNWTYGAFLRYSSGFPIPAPYAQNDLNAVMLRNETNTTFMNRVAGQPLFLKGLNCHCINPSTQLVLNPAAWSDPAQGAWGLGPIAFNDYRYQRRPQESMGLGRVFATKREGMSFALQMRFFNVFNRAEQGNPDGTNTLAPTVTGANGALNSGFGYINPSALFSPARQGQLTANFNF